MNVFYTDIFIYLLQVIYNQNHDTHHLNTFTQLQNNPFWIINTERYYPCVIENLFFLHCLEVPNNCQLWKRFDMLISLLNETFYEDVKKKIYYALDD